MVPTLAKVVIFLKCWLSFFLKGDLKSNSVIPWVILFFSLAWEILSLAWVVWTFFHTSIFLTFGHTRLFSGITPSSALGKYSWQAPRPFGMLGNEPSLLACKANVLPALLLLQPILHFLLIKASSLSFFFISFVFWVSKLLTLFIKHFGFQDNVSYEFQSQNSEIFAFEPPSCKSHDMNWGIIIWFYKKGIFLEDITFWFIYQSIALCIQE